MSKNFISAEGKKKLELELEELRVVKRREAAERVATARDFGDLSENAEYDIAKHDQAKVEARISEIENMLENVEVAEVVENSNNVVFQSSVTIKELKSGEVFTYRILGKSEANPMEGSISNESALGKAVMDKAVGETVIVDAPRGKLEYEIIEIK